MVGNEVSLACVRRVVRWSMLCADDAEIVSKSSKGLAKTMTVFVTVLEAAGLTVPAKKTETMLLRTPGLTSLAPPLVVEAADQRHRQTTKSLDVDGVIDESGYLPLETLPTNPYYALGLHYTYLTEAAIYMSPETELT